MVDLLFFELMSHLSHVKQMNSQPVHLTHELILCKLITRGRIEFNGDSTGKSPCWHQISNLPTHMIFNLQPYLQKWFCYFLGSTKWGPINWAVLWGFNSFQQVVLNTVLTLPEPWCQERVCRPSAWLTGSHKGACLWFVPAAPGVPKQSPVQSPMSLIFSVQMEFGKKY